jgi:5-methylthioadenosine/S-adenosylhomocysteine deaminase
MREGNPSTVCVRKADWVIAWDEARQAHVYLRGADVAFAGDRVVHVGPAFSSPCTEEIDGAGLMVMPGLINAHTHPSNQPSFKGVREELGNQNFYQSGLYDGRTAFAADADQRHWNARFAYWEMLRSGVTTVVDMSFPYPGWVEAAADSGLRVYVSPLFESRHWSVPNPHTLAYVDEPDGGGAAFRKAMDAIDEAERNNSGRLHGMVSPMAVDTCDKGLLLEALQAARQKKYPIHLHAGEAVMEFQEITRRYGKTQIQWLQELNFLGPDVAIGHGLFLGHHSWLSWGFRDDLRILAESGAAVSHCPTVFSRYGITMENFGAYARAGIPLGIGTDTHPHNIIEEMRHAIISGRIADRRIAGGRTIDAFNAATIGGARIALRPDLGRLAVGAKADLVLVELTDPSMMPIYDPIRSLVFTAADRAVRDVYVDGKLALKNRQAPGIDIGHVAEKVQAMQRRAAARTQEFDHSKRTAVEIAPLTLPLG